MDPLKKTSARPDIFGHVLCHETLPTPWLCTLDGAQLAQATLAQANLAHANLHAADLRFGVLGEAILTDANVARANLWKANLEGTHLERANFRHANLQQANLRRSMLQKTNLARAKLAQASFFQATFMDADVAKCNFCRAIVVETDFRGVNLAKVTGMSIAQLHTARIDETTQPPRVFLEQEVGWSGRLIQRSPFCQRVA